MGPPAAILLGFGEVEFHGRNSEEFRGALFEDVAVGCCCKARSPEREVAFGAATVRRNHKRAVCNGVAAHDGDPAVLLARVDFLGLAIHPADGGGVDEHVCALEAHDAGGFREPLVPADEHAEGACACFDGLETRVARDEVVFLVEGGVIGNVALAVEAGNAAVALEHEGGIVVDAASPLLEEGEHHHGVQFLRDGLPLAHNGVVTSDGEVKEVRVFFKREAGGMEEFRQHDQVVALALEGAGLFHVPGVVTVEIACPLALQSCDLNLAHIDSRCHRPYRSPKAPSRVTFSTYPLVPRS